MESHWWSIEVLNAEMSADRWRDAYGAALIEAAISHGAKDWYWHRHNWGVLFEVAFADDEGWFAYRQLPAVVAALDATPDPIKGLLIYPGRGGSAGSNLPRRPRPHVGAGAAPIPVEPEAIINARLTDALSETLLAEAFLNGRQPSLAEAYHR